MFQKFIFMFALYLLTSLQIFALVTIQKSRTQEKIQVGKTAFSKVNELFQFNSKDSLYFGLKYQYVTDPAYKKVYPDRTLPFTGNDNSSGIILNDMVLGLKVNDKYLSSVLANDVKVIQGEGRASVKFSWFLKWADISTKFIVFKGDNKIFCRINISPKTGINKLEFFMLTPIANAKDPKWIDKFIVSPATVAKDSWFSWNRVIPVKDNFWRLFPLERNNKENGFRAFLYEAKQVLKCASSIEDNKLRNSISYHPLTREIRLVFWSFPQDTSRKRAKNCLDGDASKALKHLQTILWND